MPGRDKPLRDSEPFHRLRVGSKTIGNDYWVDPCAETFMALPAEQVRWIAHLARLHLTESELSNLTPQLQAIVEYIDQLNEVDTDSVEPLAHPLPMQNVFREDCPAISLPVDTALANAPDRHGDFYGVPPVFE